MIVMGILAAAVLLGVLFVSTAVAIYVTGLLRISLRQLFRVRRAWADEHERYEADRRKVIMEAFRTGKPVLGTYDDDGKLVMKTLGESGEEE